MWANIVDALNVVGEVRLAADLQHKYCSTQHIAATHQHAYTTKTRPCRVVYVLVQMYHRRFSSLIHHTVLL